MKTKTKRQAKPKETPLDKLSAAKLNAHIVDLYLKCQALQKSAEGVVEYGALNSDNFFTLAAPSIEMANQNSVEVDDDAVGAAEDIGEYLHDLYWAAHQLGLALAERDKRRGEKFFA